MSALPNFEDRKRDLQARLERLRNVDRHSLVRRRLERELRDLVREELAAEAHRRRPLQRVPEYPEEQGQPLQWWQR